MGCEKPGSFSLAVGIAVEEGLTSRGCRSSGDLILFPPAMAETQQQRGSLGDASLPVNFHDNLASATNDDELLSLLQRAKTSKRPAIVTYGAPWCHACRHMLPTFCNLSNDYDQALFIYADVDKCYETTRDVRYTPTFRFYRDGEKVDEFYGAGPQRLRDRVWLHTDVSSP